MKNSRTAKVLKIDNDGDVGAQVWEGRFNTGWTGVDSYRARDIACVAGRDRVDCSVDKGYATQLYLHKE